MKIMTLVILGWLNSLQPHYLDTESAEDRSARMTRIADGITIATEIATCSGDFAGRDDCRPLFKGKPEELAVALYMIAKYESAFAEHIHAGRCRIKIGECDAGRARGMWQVHKTGLVWKVWDRLEGTDKRATATSALAGAKVWARAWNCGTPETAFAAYATSHCNRPFIQATERADSYRAALARYYRDRAKLKRSKGTKG